MQRLVSFCEHVRQGDFEGLLNEINRFHPETEISEAACLTSPAAQLKMLVTNFPEATAGYLAKVETALGAEQTDALIHLFLNAKTEEALALIDSSNCDELIEFRFLLSQTNSTKE